MTIFESLDAQARRALVDAYLRSVENALRRMNRAEIVRLLGNYDIQTIVQEFSITPEDLIPLQDAIESQFYLAGETYELAGVPARYKQIPFNRRDLRAEMAVKTEGARLVDDISADSREALQQAVMRSLRTGESPTKLAQDIAGTFNRATQTREGSIIGLSPVQEQWAADAAEELTSLDKNYLKRTLRDKRYDATFKAHLAAGKPIPTADVMRMTRRYRDKLLAYRAQVIARTETHTVLNMGRYEKVLQTAERAGLGPDAITGIWKAARDGRVRDSHGSMNGQRRGYGQPFTTGNGYRLRYPGDRSQGAPGSETINCRCTLGFKVDFS